MSRFARNVDGNQVAVVAAFRKAGAFVQHLHAVGAGCPDLLVGYRGVWRVVEVKDGRKVPSARRLTEAEAKWHERAAFLGLPVSVVESPEDAVQLLRRAP